MVDLLIQRSAAMTHPAVVRANALAAALVHRGTPVPIFTGPQGRRAAARTFGQALAQETALALQQGQPVAEVLPRTMQGLAALSETPQFLPAAWALRDRVLATCPALCSGPSEHPVLSTRFQSALRDAIYKVLNGNRVLIFEAVGARQAWATSWGGDTPSSPPAEIRRNG